MPDPSLSIVSGGIAPLGEYRDIWVFRLLSVGQKAQNKPYPSMRQLLKEAIDLILYGSEDRLKSPASSTIVKGIAYVGRAS